MHFFKRSGYTLDFFTAHEFIYEHGKPRSAAPNKPDWWKRIPNSTPTALTIKTCTGINTLYKNAIEIIMPYELSFDISPLGVSGIKETAPSAIGDTAGIAHPSFQSGGVFAQQSEHFKIDTKWGMRASGSVDFLLVDAMYNRPQMMYDMRAMDGILHGDELLNVNINCLFKKEDTRKTLTLEHGTSLAFLLPLTEKKVKIKHHLVSEHELREMGRKPPIYFMLTNSYKKSKKFNSKCPFGH